MKLQSQRTKDLVKKRNIFGIISTVLWVGTLIVLICCGFAAAGAAAGAAVTEGSSLVGQIVSMSTTAIIGLIASLLIKEKARTCIWMGSVVYASVLFGATGMYIVLAIWLIDEYIIHALYKKYKEKVTINKEIDLRA